jgi:hypothetical protein
MKKDKKQRLISFLHLRQMMDAPKSDEGKKRRGYEIRFEKGFFVFAQ